MSHTTKLLDGWIAIHDSSPCFSDLILFRRIDRDGLAEGDDIELPNNVIREFVAEMIRSERIIELERASTEELLR